MPLSLSLFIAEQTAIPESQIKSALQLFQDDCTIPFIARYRKEATNNLDETQLEAIWNSHQVFLTLEKRKKTVLEALNNLQITDAVLLKSIKNATSLTAIEDLYLPYKKSRATKAEAAKKNGLEPLAKQLMAQHNIAPLQLAQKYCTTNVPSPEAAVEGASHIIAQWYSERTFIRSLLRREIKHNGVIVCKGIPAKVSEEKAQKFKDYFNWSESLKKCPAHRFLAISRAEKEGYIRVKITIDDQSFLGNLSQKVCSKKTLEQSVLLNALEDAYKRLLLPALTKAALKEKKEFADDSSIVLFGKNLKQLLLSSPLGEKRILAIDPGFRTGCKVVCLDAQGKLLHNETIYPHPPQKDSKGAIKKISSLADAYKIEAIAIGNGTASRETEQLIKRISFKNSLQVFVVNEAGASIYSASKIARQEFPNYDITVRGAVSIGRRLADPLAELVKIEPKSIGVGQYQHDVNETKLQQSLNQVVSHCVNAVGVTVNTASYSLLKYVSGIGPKLAENIITYRKENGPFTSRKALKKVPRMGDKAYQQCVGFLRIKDSKDPLDNSSVHPEQYSIVNTIAKKTNTSILDLIGNTEILDTIDHAEFTTDNFGLATVNDVISALKKPGLDIRESAKVFAFNKNIKTLEDLQSGQILPGIVNNITHFGCFVDIGIKESGLIHISNLADEYISDVSSFIALQEQILVEVLEVDVNRKRIQLKLHKRL